MPTPTIIGMLHIPINTLLAAPPEWRNALNLPALTPRDLNVITQLEDVNDLSKCPATPEQEQAILQNIMTLDSVQILKNRMLTEADIYTRNGITTLMIENIGAPYFTRGGQPAIIYWIMRGFAEALRRILPAPTHKIGIQVLAFSDDWAMDIACRTGLDFIRCESALFEGIRPEGRTPNHGNLAKLYYQRTRTAAQVGHSHATPKVFVDLQKKHTVFPSELEPLDIWLDQLIFEKLEGIIITGGGTGLPVHEEHLAKAREAITRVKSRPYVPHNLDIPLLIGSGVTLDNLAMCARYADGFIIGSALKENGYWECPLDETRVHAFMTALHNQINNGKP